MSFRYTILLITILLSLLLAACRGAEAPVQEEAAPAEPVPTEAIVEAPATAPAEATAETLPAPTEVAVSEPIEEQPAGSTEAEVVAEPVIRTFQIIPAESQASYAVEEEFFNRPVNFFTAVGATNQIEGQFQLELNNNQVQLLENHFVVDLTTLASDDNRRDGRIRREWLESDLYPLAEFTATSLANFPADVQEGQAVNFTLNGNMTIREVTNPMAFDVTATLVGNRFTGTAVGNLLMRDYGFEPPSILGMLEVTDGVTVTVEFVADEVASGS